MFDYIKNLFSIKKSSYVVILGAGASYGSGDFHPEKPPLGNELMDRIKDSNEHTKLAYERYSDHFKVNYEIGVSMVREDPDIDESWLMHAIGQYFSKFRPVVDSNYFKLLIGLKNTNRRVVLVTTNYDLLIEQWISLLNDAHRSEEENEEDYIKWDYGINKELDNDFLLLKIHGSCNFIPYSGDSTHLTGQSFEGSNLSNANISGSDIDNINFTGAKLDNTIIDVPIKPLTNYENIDDWYENGNIHTPAMAQYDKDKTMNVGESTLKLIYERYIDSFKEASEIIMIGLAYQAHDKHIWDPIFNSRCGLRIIDPYPSKELEEWGKARKSTTLIQKITFDDYINSL